MAKIDNMMSILWMLNSDKKVTAKQISEKLEINIRTVYRYIDSLSASGVPIISDTGHNGGYTLLNNFIKAPLFFDIEEQTALLHAAIFAKEKGYFLDEALDKATSKLKMHSNQKQEEVLTRHLIGFEVIKPIGKISIESVLKKLENSIANELSIEINYRTGREEKSKCRIINPYGIVHWNNNWYIVAFCQMRNEIRSFRVDRISSVTETLNTFNRPKEFSASEFFIRGIVTEIRDEDNLIPLVIEGSIDALDNLCQHWFLGYYLKERTPNKAIFKLQEEVICTYIPNILLPYRKSIQIIEPLSIRKKIVENLVELINHYQI
ncbi:helix-turn-helix transcriptional regulator [Romboutsia lituseburensis]|uniref:helix-turn-helix transcriptional regulator n=1 Tax=Romboutsia lituseburensis TaxID=1537 RepID=UPI00215A9C0F|nr:YafY family transcriptional regulator [Romboutsia lituseburensis]MCR8747214.1 YafY family transcriptional regulator [Romboutsia lituseburensis]